MKPLTVFAIILLFFAIDISAQNEKTMKSGINTDLLYSRIPPEPESFTAGNVAARIIDGLGFRYYWATDGLRESDLDFKPSEEARTTTQTLHHIYGLSNVIFNAMKREANDQGGDRQTLTYEEIRKKTLENFKNASDILKNSGDEDIKNYQVIFQRGDNTSEFPFWNLLNGPIADAIWHTGQIASFRRSSGNPINPKISVFTGTVRE